MLFLSIGVVFIPYEKLIKIQLGVSLALVTSMFFEKVHIRSIINRQSLAKTINTGMEREPSINVQ